LQSVTSKAFSTLLWLAAVKTIIKFAKYSLGSKVPKKKARSNSDGRTTKAEETVTETFTVNQTSEMPK